MSTWWHPQWEKSMMIMIKSRKFVNTGNFFPLISSFAIRLSPVGSRSRRWCLGGHGTTLVQTSKTSKASYEVCSKVIKSYGKYLTECVWKTKQQGDTSHWYPNIFIVFSNSIYVFLPYLYWCLSLNTWFTSYLPK